VGVDPGSAERVDADRQLVARVLTGDQQAFAELFHALRNDVYRVARAVTGSDEASLDVLQDTFLKVHRGLAGWNGDAALRTWALRIAIRTSIDASRSLRRNGRGAPAAKEPSYDPRADLERLVLVQRLRDLAARISGSQGTVLRLRAFDGRSNSEIAELLGISEANVRMQLSKAVRRLKGML
jgi:RNA polymerase sigma-70 factor (ECF subfamily)